MKAKIKTPTKPIRYPHTQHFGCFSYCIPYVFSKTFETKYPIHSVIPAYIQNNNQRQVDLVTGIQTVFEEGGETGGLVNALNLFGINNLRFEVEEEEDQPNNNRLIISRV